MTDLRQSVRACCLALAFLAFTGAALEAQIVQGTVVDSGTTAPVRGAVVLAVRDGAAAPGPRVLSDVEGRFAWRAPTAGRWTLEIRAIGFVPTRREIALGDGETVRLTVRLERAALSLASVRVQERSACRGRAELAADASTLWNDVWSALTGTVASREVARPTLRVTQYARTRQVPSGVVEWEERSSSRTTSTRPFRAVAADELARRGFRIANDDGSTTFHAPDAETLVAPEFIARHCYGITRSDTGARPLLGVAFWPHRGNESSDVEGVLWVDAQSRELQLMEFHYPGLRDVESDTSRFGGFAAYARQADGSWIIDAWQIRVPVVSRTRRIIGVGNRRFGEDIQERVVQVSEEGGIAYAEGVTTRFGSVAGLVRDTAGEGQAGATVEVLGTTITGTTDSSGAFGLTGILPGRYRIRAYRGSAAAGPGFLAESEVEVRSGASVAWQPVVSDSASIRVACPERSRNSKEAAVVMVLRDGVSQRPLRSRPLQVLVGAYTGTTIRRLQRREETLERTSDWRGEMALCDVPTNAELRVREPTAATWGPAVRLRGLVTVLDIDLDAESGVVTVLQQSDALTPVTPPEIRAPTRGALVGRVVSDDSVPRLLPDAVVAVDGSPREARTGASGVFVFDDLPLGIANVRIRRLGFLPVQRAVLIAEASDTIVVRLSRAVTVLASVDVVAEAGLARIGMREFAARRAAGFGTFVDANDIAKTGARSLGSVIASHASGLDLVKVLPRGMAANGYAVASRRYFNASGQKCYSQVILNGVRVYPQPAATESEPYVIDQIDPSDVLALEIYRGAGDTPLQFGGPAAACGTVVIWTK